MKWLLNLCLLLTLVACANNSASSPAAPDSVKVNTLPENPDEIISDDSKNLIVGGQKVNKKDQIDNYTVSLVDIRQGSLCTATIIDDHFLVTAAHCLTGSKMDLKVSFALKTSSRSLHDITDFRIHPYWTPQSEKNVNDIGIVYIKENLPKGFEKASILPSNYKFENDQQVLLAGFGITDGEKNKGAGTLRSVEAKIKNAKFSETEILIDQTEHKGACHGDSGGPAFVALSDGKLLYWGVTSRGYGPNGENCESYAVYTKIMPHRRWLNWAAKEMKK